MRDSNPHYILTAMIRGVVRNVRGWLKYCYDIVKFMKTRGTCLTAHINRSSTIFESAESL